jgi:hypothetical protein
VLFEGDEAAVDREPTGIATTHRVDCGIVPTDPGRLRRGNEMLQIRAAWPIRPAPNPVPCPISCTATDLNWCVPCPQG